MSILKGSDLRCDLSEAGGGGRHVTESSDDFWLEKKTERKMSGWNRERMKRKDQGKMGKFKWWCWYIKNQDDVYFFNTITVHKKYWTRKLMMMKKLPGFFSSFERFSLLSKWASVCGQNWLRLLFSYFSPSFSFSFFSLLPSSFLLLHRPSDIKKK